MGKVNPGKRFEGWLKASMDAHGMFSLRIPDKLYWTGRNMRSEETPADFMACCSDADGNLHSYLVEAKACSKSRMNFSTLKDHQRESLLEFDAIHENAHGVVAVNFYDPVSLNRGNACFMVPISVWEEMRTKDGAMKSISHNDCLSDERIAFCPRTKGSIFDMSRWLGGKS